MGWTQYSKAIVTALGWSIAIAVAAFRGDDPDSVAYSAEVIIGVLTTLLVYLVPNKQ